jgi:hypothetical protein
MKLFPVMHLAVTLSPFLICSQSLAFDCRNYLQELSSYETKAIQAFVKARSIGAGNGNKHNFCSALSEGLDYQKIVIDISRQINSCMITVTGDNSPGTLQLIKEKSDVLSRNQRVFAGNCR